MLQSLIPKGSDIMTICESADAILRKVRDLSDPLLAVHVDKKSILKVYNEFVGNPAREESGILTKSVQVEEIIDHPLIGVAKGAARFNIITVTTNEYDLQPFAAIPKARTTIRTQPALVIPNFDLMALADLAPAYKIYTLPDQVLAAIGEVIVFLAVWKILRTASFNDIYLFMVIGAPMLGWDWLRERVEGRTIGGVPVEDAYRKLIELRKSTQVINWIHNVLTRIMNANINPEDVQYLGSRATESLINVEELYKHAVTFAVTHKPYETTVTAYWKRTYYRICGATALETVTEGKLSSYGTILQSSTVTRPVLTQSIVKWRQLIKRRVAARDGLPLVSDMSQGTGKYPFEEIEIGSSGRYAVQFTVPSADWESIISLSNLGNTVEEFTYVEQKQIPSFGDALEYMLSEIDNTVPGTAYLRLEYNCDTATLIKTHTVTGMSFTSEE